MYCSQESDSSIYAAARTESVLLIAHFTKDVKYLLREGGSCDERLSRKANDISDQVERTCSGEGRTFRISTGSLSLLFSHQLLHDLCLMLYCFRQIDEYRSTADAKLRSRPTQANKSVMLCKNQSSRCITYWIFGRNARRCVRVAHCWLELVRKWASQ